MRVRIVCYEEEAAWILGKFARKLAEELSLLGVSADIAKTPDRAADVNHHIIFLGYQGGSGSLDTLMVTHIDTEWKFKVLRSSLEQARMAVCMSSDTAGKLISAGLPADRICYINPAHDGVIKPRPLRIGITSRTYEDKRKNEQGFHEMCRNLNPEEFCFTIMGDGWGDIVDDLTRRGFHIEYYSGFDYDAYIRIVPQFDYFLYFSHDEGSMGFLDALCAAVPTIVTPQGYHLDAKGGLSHKINDMKDLSHVLETLAEQRRRLRASVARWTWGRYAQKHKELWEHLLSGAPGSPQPAGEDADGAASIGGGGTPSFFRGLWFRGALIQNSLARRLHRNLKKWKKKS